MSIALSSTPTTHAQDAVDATPPVDDEFDFAGSNVDVRHDLGNQRADDPLLGSTVGFRIVPRTDEIVCEAVHGFRLHRDSSARPALLFIQTSLYCLRLGECLVPAAFELRSDKSIGRIDGIVLLPGTIGGVPSSLQFQRQCGDQLILFAAVFGEGCGGSVDGRGLNDAKQLTAEGLIHGDRAERDASRFTVVDAPTVAAVPRYSVLLLAGVANHQLSATPAAPDQSGEQRASPFRGASAILTVVGHIGCEHRLNLLELDPRDVTLVMVADQYRPFLERLSGAMLLEGAFPDFRTS